MNYKYSILRQYGIPLSDVYDLAKDYRDIARLAIGEAQARGKTARDMQERNCSFGEAIQIARFDQGEIEQDIQTLREEQFGKQL